jgi:hypothetical protein
MVSSIINNNFFTSLVHLPAQLAVSFQSTILSFEYQPPNTSLSIVMALTFIRIFASLTLASLVAADGATQFSCYGFKNGDGYNVDMVYTNIQQLSMSSICGSFGRESKKSCGSAAVNCVTGERNC